MANWVTETEKSTFETNYVDSAINARGKTDSAAANVSFFGNSYSVVGMNAHRVGEMRDAIREYVNNVQKKLDGIEPLAESGDAFRGEEVRTAVRDYIESVKTYCMNLTSQLLEFSDKLKSVEIAWNQWQTKTSENVNAAAQGAFAQTTEYKEQL